METLFNDVRFAFRTLTKSPVFAAVAVLSLALGIGANTAMFTMVDQVLLRMLPVKDPQELTILTMKGFHYGDNWGMNALSYPMYRDLTEHNSVFSGTMCRFSYPFSVTFGGHTERVRGELVSGTYFPLLGVEAAVGRTLTPNDDRVEAGEPYAVLSYAYWKTRFAGDPSVVGKTAILNGHEYTIVGVAQAGFDGMDVASETKIFVPIMMQPAVMTNWKPLHDRRKRWVNMFARLKPGVTRDQAKASLQPFFHSILEMEVKEPAFRNASAEARARFLKNIIDVIPGGQGRDMFRRELQKPLWVLMAITGAVLLIACANLAGLLVAKAASRQKEIAIRLALGARRGRIIRQLLVESLVLSAIGGALGLALAVWTDRLLLGMVPAEVATLKIPSVPDWRVLLFTMGVTVLTAILFGLAPAVQSTRADVAPTLKDQVGAVIGARGGQVRFRKILVAGQVTLSLLLLVGAGLFIRSLQNLRGLGPGFPTGNLVAFNVDPSLNGYSDARMHTFYRELMDRINGIPGVRAAALASMRILEDNEWDSWLTIEGHRAKPNEVPFAYMNQISPGYFTALGVPVLAGRDFNVNDTHSVQHSDKPDDLVPTVAIVNEKFAKKYFGSAGNALGRHAGFGIDPNTKMDMEIVGVVKDIKYTNLRDEIPVQMFLPYLAAQHLGGMTVYVRTSMDSDQFFSAVRRNIAGMDASLPLYGMRTLEKQISNSLLVERLVAGLSTVFGALATLLAIIGLYGVMAFTVARRTREIGIRMALGAFQKDVIWMVMREVLLLVGIGVAAGLVAAIVLTRFVQTQLYGLTGHDPTTLAVSTVVLAAVACMAGYVPALRASRVDAMNALRYE